MPHFFLGNLLFFGSRSQSSGDFTQDVSLCNQLDLGASCPISPRSFASLSLSLPPLASTPSASDAVIQPRGALTPGVLSQLGRPHALQAPCLTPIPKLMWFRLASGRLIRTPPTFSCQPSPANLPLPQTPSFTACARARTRRFSSSRGSAASARSSAIRE